MCRLLVPEWDHGDDAVAPGDLQSPARVLARGLPNQISDYVCAKTPRHIVVLQCHAAKFSGLGRIIARDEAVVTHGTPHTAWGPAVIQEIWVFNCAILLAKGEARRIAANIVGHLPAASMMLSKGQAVQNYLNGGTWQPVGEFKTLALCKKHKATPPRPALRAAGEAAVRAPSAGTGRLRLWQRVSARTCDENQSRGDDHCSRHHFFPRLPVILLSIFLRRKSFSFQASSRIHHVFESLSRAAAATSSSVMALSFFL